MSFAKIDMYLGDKEVLKAIAAGRIKTYEDCNDSEYRSVRALDDWLLVERLPRNNMFQSVTLTDKGRQILATLIP